MDLVQFFTGGLPAWGLLVICPLLFVAGFVDAIGGGGGLISLPAYMFAGLDPHLTIGTNKLSSTMGTTIATIKYARSGYMEWRLCAFCVVTAVVGSAIGSHLSLVASTRFLMVFMLIALPIIGLYVVFRKDLGTVGRNEGPSDAKTFALSMLIALAVGVYDGFYGPGTGTFLMLLLTGAAKLDVFRAAGVTKAVNLTTNVTALTVFLMNGTVMVGLGLLGGAFNIAGNYLGARTFSSKGAAIVRPVILVVVAVFSVRLILQLAGVM